MNKGILSILFWISAIPAYADVHLPGIFGDNMVLQRNKPIPVWGWADPNEKIKVGFHHQSRTAVADKNGKWSLRLDAEKAGGPYELLVSGKNTIKFNNILVGEVWICSGQSNMEMPINGWGKVNNYEQEVRDANYPEIRHIKIPNAVASTPKEDIEPAPWKVCNPENSSEFTATGYFFGRELYNKLKVPIGLINSSWGGTMVETWTSHEALESSSEFGELIKSITSTNLDSLSKVRNAAITKKIEDLQGELGDIEKSRNWYEAGLDDTKWAHMSLPGLWEGKGLDGFDGVVWYRRQFEVSPTDSGKEAILELAMIDDNDITYINGVKVGGINSWNTERKYKIPAETLKAGKNTIAIRIEDTGGDGGVYGEDKDMKITIGDRTVSLAGDWSYRVESILKLSAVGPNDYPTLLFNAMINPLIPYAIKGAIWYQGEANTGRAYQYRKAFPLMISDWRKRWRSGDFPFYFVQLSSFDASGGNSRKGSEWAELREAQSLTLTLPNTGMAVTTDIGDAKDIHPTNKQDVGKRLALIALHNTYGKNISSIGPTYRAMQIHANTVTLSFNNVGSGLMIKGGDGNLSGFEVAGKDKVFYPGKAFIQGDRVVVLSDSVRHPVAVRFGWADDAGSDNLFNKEGLPAAPFRTDKWKGSTDAAKFDIPQ